MEKEKWNDIIIRLIAALVLIFAIYYLYTLYNQKKPVEQSNIEPTANEDQSGSILRPEIVNEICSGNFSQIKWKEFSDNYYDISFLYPDYLDNINYEYGMPYSFVPDNYLPIRIYNDSQAYTGIASDISIMLISIQSPNIEDWGKNECPKISSQSTCLHYDSKDKVDDEFDEHYSYTYSGMSWDLIRQGDKLFAIYIPYQPSCEINVTTYIKNKMIKSLNFKDK